MNDDKIKDLFASKLKDFEPEVPSSIWGGLDQILSQQSVSATDSSSVSNDASTKQTSFVKPILIIIGIVAAIIVAIIFFPENEEMITLEDNNKGTIAVKTESVVEPDIEEQESVTKFVKPVVADNKTTEQVSPAYCSETEIIDESQNDEPTAATIQHDQRTKKSGEKEKILFEFVRHKKIKPQKSSSLSLNVSVNAGLLAESIQQSGVQSENGSELPSMDESKHKDGVSGINHKIPISFGLTISKRLSPNISVETGLFYTYLSSNITFDNAIYMDAKQTFHYLGVPLSLNYSFYKHRNIDLYLSLGAMIQKDISGRYEKNIVLSNLLINNDITSSEDYLPSYFIKEKIKQSAYQFSTYLKLGIAYPIYKKLYLYGTVGGAYYFDAHNQYPTIYSDQKFQLDLNLGVKFGF